MALKCPQWSMISSFQEYSIISSAVHELTSAALQRMLVEIKLAVNEGKDIVHQKTEKNYLKML